jgi:hypothetical protein
VAFEARLERAEPIFWVFAEFGLKNGKSESIEVFLVPKKCKFRTSTSIQIDELLILGYTFIY